MRNAQERVPERATGSRLIYFNDIWNEFSHPCLRILSVTFQTGVTFRTPVTFLTTCDLPNQTKRIFIGMNKIDHIGIAVNDLHASIPLFEALLNTPCYKTEMVETEGVTTAFFQCGDSKIELVEGAAEGNPIRRFIAKRGEGIHHIAFEVTDIEAEKQRLQQAGFAFVSEEIRQGAEGKQVCFLHPKATNGVLVELVM